MPLAGIIDRSTTIVGWWFISESEDDLYNKVSLTPQEKLLYQNFTSVKRKMQWLAVRVLLAELLRGGAATLRYDLNGKPEIGGNQKISISHSGDMAAIQISNGTYCGIDVQRISDKMPRLAPKFINAQEAAFIPTDRANEYYNLIWTLKEAIFKNFGTSVEFKRQIIIQPFSLDQHEPIEAEVDHHETAHYMSLEWQRIGDYFLSYLC